MTWYRIGGSDPSPEENVEPDQELLSVAAKFQSEIDWPAFVHIDDGLLPCDDKAVDPEREPIRRLLFAEGHGSHPDGYGCSITSVWDPENGGWFCDMYTDNDQHIWTYGPAGTEGEWLSLLEDVANEWWAETAGNVGASSAPFKVRVKVRKRASPRRAG